MMPTRPCTRLYWKEKYMYLYYNNRARSLNCLQTHTCRAMSNFKLKDPQTCRIFFSSPFGGMEDEREELTRKYFPQIQHFCSQYGVNFVAVDMRWGITSEASSSSQVINICLRELDRSDFFAGFFGQVVASI